MWKNLDLRIRQRRSVGHFLQSDYMKDALRTFGQQDVQVNFTSAVRHSRSYRRIVKTITITPSSN
jgi:hypothetical protein